MTSHQEAFKLQKTRNIKHLDYIYTHNSQVKRQQLPNNRQQQHQAYRVHQNNNNIYST